MTKSIKHEIVVCMLAMIGCFQLYLPINIRDYDSNLFIFFCAFLGTVLLPFPLVSTILSVKVLREKKGSSEEKFLRLGLIGIYLFAAIASSAAFILAKWNTPDF